MINDNQYTFYGKNESIIISGIALIMMLIHHLLPEFVYLFKESSIPFVTDGRHDMSIARLCKLCVAFFAFKNGYAIWLSRSNSYDVKFLARKIFNLLLAYWLVYGIFILFAYITNDSIAPTLELHLFHLFGFHLNMGYICPISAWFIFFFIAVVFLTPLLTFIIKQKIIYCTILTLILLTLIFFAQLKLEEMDANSSFFHLVQSIHIYLPCVISGMLCAKYHIFERLFRILDTQNYFLKIIILLLIILASFYTRHRIFYTDFFHPFLFDAILSAVLVFAFIAFIKNIPYGNFFSKILYFIGIYSMNLWLLQSIYFVGKREPLHFIFSLKYSILFVPLSILLIFPLAMLLNYLNKFISFPTSKS